MKTMRWNFLMKFSSIGVLMVVMGFAGISIADEKRISAQTAVPVDAARQADIEVFVRQGCIHCEKAKTFLSILAFEQPDLRISTRDIGQDLAALERLQEISKAQGISRLSVPAFYLNGRIIFGYSDEAKTGSQIRGELAQRRQQSQASAPAGLP